MWSSASLWFWSHVSVKAMNSWFFSINKSDMYGTLDGTVFGFSPWTLNSEKQLRRSCALIPVGKETAFEVAFGWMTLGRVSFGWMALGMVSSVWRGFETSGIDEEMSCMVGVHLVEIGEEIELVDSSSWQEGLLFGTNCWASGPQPPEILFSGGWFGLKKTALKCLILLLQPPLLFTLVFWHFSMSFRYFF